MRTLILWLVIFLLTPGTSQAAYPQAADEYINDFAHLIDNSREASLRKKLYDLEYYSGIELSVSTIDTYAQYQTGAATWEEFSTGLFNHWGVGNMPANNGILLLISKNDRKIRIELGAGYPDHYNSIMKSVIDNNIAPELKVGNYTQGIEAGIDQIIAKTTRKISFFEWYKKYIFTGFGAFISLIIALIIERKERPGLFWISLAIAGILILYVWRGLGSGRRSDGFGGGSSRGGGASGSF